MDYSKKQKELDISKWVDSESKNHDTCGEYNYCKCCNKSNTFPCAYAYEKFNNNTKFTTPTTKTKTSTTIKSNSKSTKSSKKSTSRYSKIAA